MEEYCHSANIVIQYKFYYLSGKEKGRKSSIRVKMKCSLESQFNGIGFFYR